MHDSLAPKTVAKIDALLDGDLIPILGKTEIGTLGTPQAAATIEKMASSAPHMAQKAKSYLNQIIDFAIRKGLHEDGRKLTLKGTVRLPRAGSVPAAAEEDTLRQVMAIFGRTAVAVLATLPPNPVTHMLRREIASFSWARPLPGLAGLPIRVGRIRTRICSRPV